MNNIQFEKLNISIHVCMRIYAYYFLLCVFACVSTVSRYGHVNDNKCAIAHANVDYILMYITIWNMISLYEWFTALTVAITFGLWLTIIDITRRFREYAAIQNELSTRNFPFVYLLPTGWIDSFSESIAQTHQISQRSSHIFFQSETPNSTSGIKGSFHNGHNEPINDILLAK